MTGWEIGRALGLIRYKPTHDLNWKFSNSTFKVWWEFERLDSVTGEMGIGTSGYVSFEMGPDLTEEALVRGVWGMTLRLEEHEAREFFMYDDQKPFDPHQRLVKNVVTEP